MPPVFSRLFGRDFQPGYPSIEFSTQWQNPSDVFSVLLILGGDVVARALAQLSGSYFTPVAFSFGWITYAVGAVVSAVGENTLMPLPDCSCKVINGRSGYVRDNASWVIGRIVRDYDKWMDEDQPDRPIRTCWKKILDDRWKDDQAKADAKQPGTGKYVKPLPKAGLCVSIYKAKQAQPGNPGRDALYYSGIATSIIQLGIAAIPCGLYGDWGILLITTCGILLSLATGSLSQWKREKWRGRENTEEKFVLTRGNGAQHAIVVIGNGKGLNLEDMAYISDSNESASFTTKIAVTTLAAGWILLLITAAGLHQNTWFLLAVGGLGMLHNIFVAGSKRSPKDFGLPLRFYKVIGHHRVMQALFDVEEEYPRLGRSMRDTFFPGKLRDSEEEAKWLHYENRAKTLDEQKKAAQTKP